jgi:hypothetical protein
MSRSGSKIERLRQALLVLLYEHQNAHMLPTKTATF